MIISFEVCLWRLWRGRSFPCAVVGRGESSPTLGLHVQPSLCPTDPEAYVRCHNAKRRLHGVPDVRWSAAAAESAAAWARQGRFQHSDVTEYGENLYRSDSPPLPGMPSPELQVCCSSVSPRELKVGGCVRRRALGDCRKIINARRCDNLLF